MLFKASRHGMERLEIGDSDTDKNPKIVTLENCVKITQEPPPANLIHIVSKTGSLTLNPTTEEDLKLWLTALQSVAFKEKADQSHSSSSAGGASSSSLMRTTSSAPAIEEDNDLYCSSYDGVFVINLVKTEASQRCNIPEKIYKLSLGPTDLLLVAFEDEAKVVTKWPYRFIRKYGYRDGHFTFEAGRKCDTGEGNFSLDHASPQEIFRCMSTKMKSMKKLMHGDPSLNAEEAQLSVAVSSMEAGSRSPIPLFPTTPSSDFDINSASSAQLHHSFASVRGFLSSVDSLNSSSNVSTTSSSIPLLKHIPNKPPRKTLLPEGNHHHHSNSNNNSPTTAEKLPELPKRNAPSSSSSSGPREYECIEPITDAWRTMGIDDVRHTEHVKDGKTDLIDFSVTSTARAAAKKESLLLDTVLRPGKKLVEIKQEDEGGDASSDDNCGDNGAEGNYDHLEYFRSNSKTSSAYKTVIPVSPPPVSGVSLTQLPAAQMRPAAANDDYEIIGAPPPTAIDTKMCRKADDSYLGYGVLRRPIGLPLPPTPNAAVSSTVKIKSPSASEANKALFLEMTNNNNNNNNNTNNHNSSSSSSSSHEVLLKNSAILLTSDATTICEKRMEMLANGDLVEDVDDVLGHRKFNGLEYAIVSKPKRV